MIGQTISHYNILEKLGEGGMGAVYLAEDTELDRKVALKFLPAGATDDPEIKARFKREAKAAAALNHPNIVTIHEIGEHEGQSFLVMEYVEGTSLKDRIGAHSSVPQRMNEIIDIASQICEGLAAAHKADVVHRDIKPDNVLITSDGRAKIADFGLAKLKGVTRLTKEDTTMGTVYYMSPEQAVGEDVDRRSDIFSFGVVLYEMITGQLPFGGEYEAAISYSILHEEPEPLARYKSGVSEGLQRIVDKALDKDKETRYQNITDVLADLKRERRSTSELSKPVAKVKSRKLKRALFRYFSAAVAVSLVALGLLNLFNRPPSTDTQLTHKQVTFVGDASWPAISPDGQFIAYARGKTGDGRVIVEDLAGGQPIDVSAGLKFVGSIYGGSLAWSPNGAELIFSGIADSSSFPSTYIVPRLGGSVRPILAGPAFNSWSSDGAYIANTYTNWKTIEITNSTDRFKSDIDVSGPFEWLLGIEWSPLSNRLLFLTQDNEQSAIWTVKIDGTQMQNVVEDRYALSRPRWAANGKAIYYFRTVGNSKQLMKVEVSPKTGNATAKPEILQSGMEAGAFFTISRDNKRLFYTRELRYSNLLFVRFNDDNTALSPRQLTTGTLVNFAPSFSPDGKKIAFSAMGQHSNIFVMPAEGGEMQQLTYMNAVNASPVWSPDGREIAFGSRDGETSRVWKVSGSGGTTYPYNNTKLSTDSFSLTWAPGADILYQRPGNHNFHRLDPKTEQELPLVQNNPLEWIFIPCYSPDGKKVAIYRNIVKDKLKPGLAGLWSLSLEDSSHKFLQKGELLPITWSDDGKWIYALTYAKTPHEVLMVPVDGGETKHLYTLPVDEIHVEDNYNLGITMTPDGKKLVYAAVESKPPDVWVMEHFDPENELEPPIAIPDFPEYKQLAYVEDGWDLMRQKKYAEAEKVYREGLKLGPKNVMLLNGLGLSLNHQGNYAEAEKTFRGGLEIAPKHAAMLNGARTAAFYNRNYEAARRYNEESLKNPRFGKALAQVSLGAIDILEKNYANAESNLHKALESDSTHAAAYTHFGYLYAEQARFTEALTFSEKALSLDSTFENQNLIGWVLVAGDLDIERGLSFAEKALNSKPESWAQTADAYSYFAIPEHTLGLAYLKKGNYEKAVQYLEQALEVAPNRQAVIDDLKLARQKLAEMTKK